MLRNVGSNWVLILAGIAATYVLTPFVIGTLGQEGYGTWTLITAMTGYMSLLATGVPMASVRYLAQHVAEGDAAKLNATIGSCAGLYLAIGAVAVPIGIALTVAFAAFYEIPPTFQAQAYVAFAIMVVHVSLSFVGILPEGIMFAHHDFVPRNVIRIGGVLLRLALTVALLSQKASLIVLASIQLICLGVDFLVSSALIKRRYAGVRINLLDFNWKMLRQIFSFSIYVLLMNAGGRLSFETDALVIGAFLSVSAIPYFVVANSLVLYLMEFVVAIAAVVAPMTTKLRTEGREAELREMFLKWSKVALSLSLLVGVFLIVFGARFIGWWIDPSFEQPADQVLRILVISSVVFLPVRGVALPLLMGLGNPRTPTIACLVTGVLNLLLSILLVRPFGLAGVALGTAIPNVLFAVVILVTACRELGISATTYLNYVVTRAVVGALPLLALLVWCKVGLRVDSIVGLMASGSAVTLLFAVTWIFFVYRNDPYVDLRSHVGRFRVWSQA